MRRRFSLSLLISLGLLFLSSEGVLAYRPQVMGGWPKMVGTSATLNEMYGATLGDVDGDGNLDVLVGTSRCSLYVWDYQGNALPGWPQSLPGMIHGPPTLGDVNGDGQMSVVAVCRQFWPADTGYVYVWDSQGQLLPGWPQEFVGISPTSSLSDLDGDGELEILIEVESEGPGSVCIFRSDGTNLPGWPQNMSSGSYICPSIGDVDNDTDLEIVALSLDSVYVWQSDGTLLPGWPVGAPSGYIFYVYAPPALADFDGDGDLEIVAVSGILGPPFDGYIHIYHHNGEPLAGWPRYCVGYSDDSPAVGDVDADGDLEIVISTFADILHVLNPDSSETLGWPFSELGLTGCYPILGDIDGDGRIEIVSGDNRVRNGGRLHCFEHDGAVAACWPLGVVGFTCWNPPVLGDVEPDGTLNMLNISSSSSGTESYIWLWDLLAPYDPDRIEWGCFSHDVWHTGCYGFQVPQ